LIFNPQGGVMKAIKVNYQVGKDIIEKGKDESVEDWLDVCDNFNNDVHKVRHVSGHKGYTSLYECFDDDNVSSFYMVAEDEDLYSVRKKNRLRSLGLDK
jgi:hypothetical protein